jgi:mono/diheme cytochrome c family protein
MAWQRLPVATALAAIAVCIGCHRPSAENGEALFRKNCGGCHSMRADRVTDAPVLRGYFARVPQPGVAEVRRQIMDGGRSMPPFRKRLSGDDVDDLVAFLESWR